MSGGIIMRESWNSIVSKYPDKWVVLKNVIFNGPDIKSAEIVCVKEDSEIFDYQDDHLDDNFIFRRTTETVNNGTVSANFTIELN